MGSFLSYREAATAGPDRVGGKAWNLAQLATLGFSVPKGIAVERTLYRDILAYPPIKAMVEQLARLDLDAVAGNGAAVLLEELRTAISTAALEPHVREELNVALDQAGLTDKPLAVRSSASGEDGACHTFAGIHESFLNVRGTEQVAGAILKCFASLWTTRALVYRRRFGIPDREVDGAVLICAMINAEGQSEPVAAGVTFTADPQNGRRDTFVIEAVRGLGDKLVSGQVNSESLRIHFTQYDAPFPKSNILPHDALHELVLQCGRIQWIYSDGEVPQDIEWAWDGKTIFILQARPITVLPRRIFPEIADQPSIWTNANFKEVLSGILSPMSWSLLPRSAAKSFFDTLRIAGYHELEGMRIVRRFDGRLYADAAIIQFATYDALGILPNETNRTLGGFQPEITLPQTGWRHRRRTPRQMLHLIRGFIAILRGQKKLPKLLERIELQALARSREDLTYLSATELLDKIQSVSQPEWMPPFMLAYSIGTSWFGIARALAGKRLSPHDFDTLAGGLMAARGGIVSADHAYALQGIRSRFTRGSPDYKQAMAEWMGKYGHRGFNELDLASPRWREAPHQVEILAQELETGPTNPLTAQSARNRSEAMRRSLPFLFRWIITYTLNRAAKGFRIREQAKSCLVAVTGISRLITLEWGRRLVSENRIADRNDAFFLTCWDFWAWANGYWNGDGAQRLVEQRKAQFAVWQAKPQPPDVFIEKAEALETLPVTAPVLQGNRLQGNGVSPGQARGTARKLHSPLEAANFKNGDILLVRATDPSWTPLFLRASGIVVEMGGYLSHGAIVAREFGLPAVVNIPGCFEAIPDGAELFVDGNLGLVEVGVPRSE